MVSYVDNVNATESKFGAYSLTNANYATYGYTNLQSGRRYFSTPFFSFWRICYKYLPMSAINGLRIVLSCENALGAVVLKSRSAVGITFSRVWLF